jgi:hypothetical protein
MGFQDFSVGKAVVKQETLRSPRPPGQCRLPQKQLVIREVFVIRFDQRQAGLVFSRDASTKTLLLAMNS